MIANLLRRIACGLIFLIATQAHAEDAAKPLSLGEEPYASPTLLAGKYQSVINYLQRKGIGSRYLPARDYAHYVQQANQQQLDIAFASSGLASLLTDKFSYEATLASDNTLNAVVFVNARSNLQTLQQLTNASILAPEPYDIVYEMAHRLIAARGMEQTLMPHIVQTSKVDKIILSVLKGEHAAGIVAGYDLALVKPDLRKMVRIIEQSDNVVAHYILLRKTLPAAQKAAIKKAMLAFYNSPEGNTYASDFGSSKFVALEDAHQQELLAFREFGEFISNAPPAEK